MDLNLNSIIYYILIIDHDTDGHSFLRTALNRVVPHALIESIFNSNEVQKLVESCVLIPNLILLDRAMANAEGNNTIKTLKQNELLKKVPIVVYTNTHDVKEKAELLQLGISGVYTKPNQIDDLIAMVIDVKNNFLH
jgi:DNA-binding NtrC family response regulator